MPSDATDRTVSGGRLQRSIFAPFTLFRRFKLEKVRGFCRKSRRGAAVVEFAVVAPIFFLLVFGMIEYGRMVMVQQIITNASREGARVAILDGMTTADVETKVGDYLIDNGITGANVGVATNAAVAPDYAESMTIAVDIPFGQVSWLPTPIYLSGKQLTATTTMRREAVN
jgi:Flp pilus assembly protein TadG